MLVMCSCYVATAGTLLHCYCCSAVVVAASLRLLLLHSDAAAVGYVGGRGREGWAAVAVRGRVREEWGHCKRQRERENKEEVTD